MADTSTLLLFEVKPGVWRWTATRTAGQRKTREWTTWNDCASPAEAFSQARNWDRTVRELEMADTVDLEARRYRKEGWLLREALERRARAREHGGGRND